MRIAPRTIYAKGLILICVPLLVVYACGVSMFSLQRFYEEKLAKERAAVEIIFNANEMWINCTELMFLKGYFNLFGGEKPAFEERVTRIMDQYQLVKNLVATNAAQTQNLEKIHSYTLQSLELSNQLRPLSSPHQTGSGKMAVLISNLEILGQAERITGKMAAEIEFFRNPEFLSSQSAVSEVEKSTAFVDRAVLGSLAASTLVALLLFVYFIRSINQGINVVVQNTERFKKGLELEPPVRGGDELAQVDAAFHEMAEEIKEAQRTKQKIVSMISHDLRSPLTSVLGYLSNFKEGVFGDAPEETLLAAGTCEQDLDRLIRLINDLLDLDKIEAGKFELQPKTLAADQVIDQVISKMLMVADDKGVNIKPAQGSGQIHGDPDRIVQALANVFSTTIRLAPTGSSVETAVVQHDGEAEISVTCPGASISEDQLAALFDRYQQSESGLRLELPISREIIKLHGGTIAATALSPTGITFKLRLPSAQPDEPA